jgi:hypothetical protein
MGRLTWHYEALCGRLWLHDCGGGSHIGFQLGYPAAFAGSPAAMPWTATAGECQSARERVSLLDLSSICSDDGSRADRGRGRSQLSWQSPAALRSGYVSLTEIAVAVALCLG